MAAVVSTTNQQLAVLGGTPAFSAGNIIPLIQGQVYGYHGDFSALDAILRNEPNDESKTRSSQQRFVAKILPGVEGSSLISFRAHLQARIGNFLKLDPDTTSVICVTSGTNALRSVLRTVYTEQAVKDGWNEVIVPQITVGATIEAVIAEGFHPVFVAVDPTSWLLDPMAAECAISDKTAAIITVDWLGTQCNVEPFRKLADKHGIKLISDSAQSFGANHGGSSMPRPVDLAYATIYSLGYPKVFTGAGSGGVIVCSKALADLLERDITGILRHETLAEANAFMCLRALETLPEALSRRAAAGEMYRQFLSGVPGIKFQEIPDGMGTNHYQVSFTVDANAFGLSAKQLCQVLKAENVCCSADRMPCVAVSPQFQPYGRAEGDMERSQLLAKNAITLPISNVIDLNNVKMICHLVRLTNENAQEILRVGLKKSFQRAPFSTANISIDLESKFRNNLIVPVLDDSSVHSKIIVPYKSLFEHSISVDELLAQFMTRKEWIRGESVSQHLVVDAIVDNKLLVILSPKSATGNPFVLEESGSSASVTLMPSADGKLIVRKSALGYGIDGNGAPWLRRQSLFLNNSIAVQKTGMFVVPSEFKDMGNHVALELPYIASHSFGELAFANVGAQPLATALVDMVARMANSVWTEGQETIGNGFIEKAHFDRMRRRVKIARAENRVLDKILTKDTVILNGRRIRGFETIMSQLEKHPMLADIQPTILSEIHGDLNIYNILSPLKADYNEDVALVDPRGVPLLGDGSNKKFECGDYGYDISKLLFSLSGFSIIRQRLFDYSADGESHHLTIQPHPGLDTMNGAAQLLIPALASNQVIKQWIDKVEIGGVRSFELRVRVGEAAHFISDCACALGRNTPWEVVPLFLIGLEKLNSVVNLLDDICRFQSQHSGPANSPYVPLGADIGVGIIQNTLFNMQTTLDKSWPYDVLEVSVKVESAATAKKLLRGLVGTYLPKETVVHLSTDPLWEGYLTACHPPCLVLIHSSNGTRGQTHMLAAAVRKTVAFYKDNGIAQSEIEKLRILHISSTGSSSRSQFAARSNDKLLSPGTFGISPLELAVMQSLQLPFPKPGRWIVENDSFFLISKGLVMSGDNLCLLVIERPTSGSTSSWRVCIDKYALEDGLLVARSFRNIQSHEQIKLPRATTGMFIPHRLAETLSLMENDYATRTSSLFFDLVLPRFLERNEWIKLCHQKGYGSNSHLAWRNAGIFGATGVVELAKGGDEMAFFHFGSDKEYYEFLAGVRKDPRLNSLAYAGAAIRWLHTHFK